MAIQGGRGGESEKFQKPHPMRLGQGSEFQQGVHMWSYMGGGKEGASVATFHMGRARRGLPSAVRDE